MVVHIRQETYASIQITGIWKIFHCYFLTSVSKNVIVVLFDFIHKPRGMGNHGRFRGNGSKDSRDINDCLSGILRLSFGVSLVKVQGLKFPSRTKKPIFGPAAA